MTAPSAPGPSRQGRLEEVLEEYMRRLDRGEAVDREQFLAHYPELASQLLSYFAGCDDLEQFGRREGPALPSTDHLHGPGRCEEAPPVKGGARVVGDYELLGRIGQGGMGVIYKARQRSLQRLVALKMIRPDRLTSPADVLRFRSEAEAAAALDHPNIVPIYEVGTHGGQHYFSMKLVEGGSLAEHLPRLAADPSAAAAALAAVARAVHHAHRHGILHRDLKPANILLDADGQPHVTDFGLAKRLGRAAGDASLTQQGVIVGTPNYMAPEQAAPAAGVSTAADVYSLGAILYELLTGRPPFQTDSPLETLVLLREREPVPPRSLNRRADRDLEIICLKCLHKEPGRRYASALALAEDLERWGRGEPIHARAVSRRERFLKWVRRRPALAALAALLVLTSVAGVAGVSWQWWRAEGEYRTAVRLAEAERRTAYARTIALAHARWVAGNAGFAEQVLGECPPELHGWEYYYLRRLFRARQLATLEGHPGGVRAVAFSPDGTRFASAGADGTVKVWDRGTLREAFTLRGHAGAVTAVAFSPDGHYLTSGGADGTVRVWDAVRGKPVAAWRAHAAGVTGLAFDPAGRRLASTGAGEPSRGELKLWKPMKGEALVGKAWHNVLAAVAFSPDGRRLATAGLDGSVAVWDASTLEMSVLGGPTERDVHWTSVAFSADGVRLAAGSSAGVVRVWQGAPRDEGNVRVPLRPSGREFLNPTQAGVSGVAFGGRDGRLLIAATADNTIQGWFTRSGKPAFTLRGHRRPVTAVACSPDGRCLVSGGREGAVRLWDLRQRDEELTLRAPNQGVIALAFSPDGTRLASATRDRTLRVWAVTGESVFARQRLPEAARGVAFSPDGRRLASAEADGTIRLRDAADGEEVATLPEHDGPAHAVAYSPDGARLASAGSDGTVRVRDVSGGREVLCLRGHDGPAHAVAYSPDDGRLASGGEDGVARVWDAAGREALTLRGHDGPVYAVAFSRDGRELATAGRDEVVRVWDAATGVLLRSLRGHAGAVRCLACGPGGRLASAGDDRTVRLWDAAGQELLALRGHTRTVRALAFSPDGHRLASAGDDHLIKVWDGTPPE